VGVRQLTETTPLEFFSSQRREGQTACHTRTSLAFSSRLWQSMHEQPVQYCLAAKQSQYSLRHLERLHVQRLHPLLLILLLAAARNSGMARMAAPGGSPGGGAGGSMPGTAATVVAGRRADRRFLVSDTPAGDADRAAVACGGGTAVGSATRSCTACMPVPIVNPRQRRSLPP
jgi:hypothetical protein